MEGPDEASPTSATGDVPVADVPWQRLDARVIWVDVAQTLLSLAPIGVATWGFGVDIVAGGAWPLLAVGVAGVLGAVSDAWRWTFTRYRITDEHVERRTGRFVRSYRSVRRDRIRSVDVHAKLRHRLARLRVVEVGAGQRASAGEAALDLDAVRVADAEALRHTLMPTSPVTDACDRAAEVRPDDGDVADGAKAPDGDQVHIDADIDAGEGNATGGDQVLARLRAGWVIHNLFSVWALLLAAGLLWGAQWLAWAFGYDLAATVGNLLDWSELGWGWSTLLAVAAVGIVGVVGMAVNFFTTHWAFELARVRSEEGTQLRTRQGLFTTREVHRDEARLRGVQVAEPVLWRWLGVADTTVITTGLDEWSMAQPTAVLPRCPVTVARPVAAAVLGADPNPLAAPLRPHPLEARRRRMWWATLVSIGLTAVLGWLAVTDVVPAIAVWAGVASWPLSLLAALVATRALGHTICGDYLVVRSGLVSRATAVLQRSAVSTIAVRESFLQRRLGLRTVSAMTSAGYGVYEAPDLDAQDAVAFAVAAAPGLLDPFLTDDEATATAGPVRRGTVPR